MLKEGVNYTILTYEQFLALDEINEIATGKSIYKKDTEDYYNAKNFILFEDGEIYKLGKKFYNSYYINCSKPGIKYGYMPRWIQSFPKHFNERLILPGTEVILKCYFLKTIIYKNRETGERYYKYSFSDAIDCHEYFYCITKKSDYKNFKNGTILSIKFTYSKTSNIGDLICNSEMNNIKLLEIQSAPEKAFESYKIIDAFDFSDEQKLILNTMMKEKNQQLTKKVG